MGRPGLFDYRHSSWYVTRCAFYNVKFSASYVVYIHTAMSRLLSSETFPREFSPVLLVVWCLCVIRVCKISSCPHPSVG